MPSYTDLFDTVTIGTAFTPPLTMRLDEPPNPTTQNLLNLLRPNIQISGPAGVVSITQQGATMQLSPAFNQNIETAKATGIGFGTLIAAFLLYRVLR